MSRESSLTTNNNITVQYRYTLHLHVIPYIYVWYLLSTSIQTFYLFLDLPLLLINFQKLFEIFDHTTYFGTRVYLELESSMTIILCL